MSLAGITQIKAMLGIPSIVSTHDTKIGFITEVADGIALDRLGLSMFGVTNYSEVYSFDYQVNNFRLPKQKVQSIVALTVNSVAYVEGTDFRVDYDKGRLFLKNGNFPIGQDLVEITWTAGFESGTHDYANLTYACCAIGVKLFNEESHHAFTEEKAGEYTYKLNTKNDFFIPPIASHILDKWISPMPEGIKGRG